MEYFTRNKGRKSLRNKILAVDRDLRKLSKTVGCERAVDLPTSAWIKDEEQRLKARRYIDPDYGY